MVLGALAQLGEHLLCKQGVIGSIPIGSTMPTALRCFAAGSRQPTTPEMKTRYPAFMVGQRGFALRFFDIVNGFLIDAVVHWCVVQGPHADASLTDVESG